MATRHVRAVRAGRAGIAHQMKLRRMVLRARWLPRDENQEADDLTNYEFRHFDPTKRFR